ncbi:MAG: MotB family protein [Hyphomicrobium sp.]|jgi:chemotaxis protein MotB
MSTDGDAPAAHEVVIVRRRGGEADEGHHGGAWKIAFADLMTAMMAFFLVMWLLNASDKEKIQQIATYFNPIKLNSKRPTAKGVEQTQDVPKAAKADKAGRSEKQNPVDAKDGLPQKKGFKSGGDGDKKTGSEKQAEDELFNDPYGVLAKLVLKAGEGREAGGGGKDAGLLSGGDAYSNPFEPFNERPPPESVVKPTTASPLSLEDANPLGTDAQLVPDPPAPAPSAEPAPEVSAAPAAPTAPSVPVETSPAVVPPAAGPAVPAAPSQWEQAKEDARKLEGEILNSLAGLSPEDRPSIEVTKTEEGLLISLTDDFRFGMFASASAEPNPDLVLVMDKVGKVLSGREGNIVVRGHTDGHQFKSQRDNNWRLSTARAQIAVHMLVRGGVAEQRFERIEGHADRSLRVPSDAFAAQNRRIEILLKVPKV